MTLTKVRGSPDVTAWARSCLGAWKRPSEDEKESLENKECFDRLNALRLQKQEEESDRRLADGSTGGDDARAKGSSRGLSSGSDENWMDEIARELSLRRASRSSSLGQVWEHRASEGDRDKQDGVEDSFIDLQLLVSEGNKPLASESGTSDGGSREGGHVTSSNNNSKDETETEGSSGTEKSQSKDDDHLMSIDDIIDLKLLLAKQHGAIDTLELANRRLAITARQHEADQRTLEALWRSSRERELRLEEELERATRGQAELEGKNDTLAQENTELRARLCHLAEKPSSTDSVRVSEVEFDCSVTRRAGCAVGSHHVSMTSTCATAESLDNFDVCAVFDKGFGGGSTTNTDSQAGLESL